MNKKKERRERSEQMQQASAGLQDLLGLEQWRQEHAQASLREIEEAVDERINQVRAELIQELAQKQEETDWSHGQEHPQCGHCGEDLLSRGRQTRWLQTNGGQTVKLTRRYGTCPRCGVGFFPPG